MYRRVLTYDLKSANIYDYKDLYDYFKQVNAKKLTESSYLIETTLPWADFEGKIKRLTKYGDNVKAIIIVGDMLTIKNIR